MKPYLLNMCSAPFLQRTLSRSDLLQLGASRAGLGMVGGWAAAKVDGCLRLCVGVASLGWRKLRPELPPSSVRLLDTKRLRICDKLIKFITTQDLFYPRTASEILTETPCIILTSLLLYQLVNRLYQVMDLTCWARCFLEPPGGSGEVRYRGLP